MEKLGFGPQDCLSLNPALVYGRVTGWGQDDNGQAILEERGELECYKSFP